MCETLSLAVTEINKLQVFENNVSREMSGPKKYTVSNVGHCVTICDLYRLPITKVVNYIGGCGGLGTLLWK